MTNKIFNSINHKDKKINYDYKFDFINESMIKVIESYEFIFINNYLKTKDPIKILEDNKINLSNYEYTIKKDKYFTIVRFFK